MTSEIANIYSMLDRVAILEIQIQNLTPQYQRYGVSIKERATVALETELVRLDECVGARKRHIKRHMDIPHQNARMVDKIAINVIDV